MTEWITTSTPYLTPRSTGERDPWAAEAEQTGHAGGHRLVLVELREAPEVVADRLGIGRGERAVLRRRVVTLDERPVEIADSWYPAAMASGTGLAQAAPIRGGALRLLADLGYTAARHVEDVAVADPPEDAAQYLGAGPVLELIRTSFTDDGVPFEVAVMLMSRDLVPGTPRRLRYELTTR